MTSSRRTLWRSPLWLLALLAIALATGLHLYFVSHAGGFWRDEVNLINLARSGSLVEMQKDSFPVLLPWLVHVWLGAGLGEVGLRWAGGIVGLGILAAICFAAWKTNRTPPLVGLALFGLNSTLIVFGDSLRAYGLGCLFIVLVVFCGAYFLRRPGWSRAAWLAVAGVFSVQTLYHNAILVGAVCLGAMLVSVRRRDWPSVTKVFSAGAVAALSLLPYLPNLLAAREGSATLRTGLKMSRLLEGFHDAFGFPVPQYIWLWAALAVGLLVQGWLALRPVPAGREAAGEENIKTDLGLFAAATFILSFAGFFGFLWLAGFPSQSWYLLPLMAVAVVCVDFAWPLWPEKWRFALACFALVTTVVAVPVSWRTLHCRFTNVDLWTRQMNRAVAPDDYVIVVPWFCGITFGHYFQNPAGWDTLPPLADHAVHRFDLVKARLQETNAIAPVLGKISATLAAGHQVWLLSLKGWMDVPEPGTTAAATLPPAPFTRFGWSEVPYTMSWVSQVAHRVGDQSTQFARVPNPAAAGCFIEDTELFRASGWRGATNAIHAR